eukprot:Lankesteria_metandrocarpae@DN3743_c0_g1_i1.p1
MSTRLPAVKWAQDLQNVFLTVNFGDISNLKDLGLFLKIDLTENTLLIECPVTSPGSLCSDSKDIPISNSGVCVDSSDPQSSSSTTGATSASWNSTISQTPYRILLNFSNKISVEHSTHKLLASGKDIKFTLKKAQAQVSLEDNAQLDSSTTTATTTKTATEAAAQYTWWSKLTVGRNLSTVSVDWALWQEEPPTQLTGANDTSMMEDDSSSGQGKGAKLLIVEGVEFTSADATPLDDCPDLQQGTAWITYFTDRMTTPQRMLTLVQLWNASDADDRHEIILQLTRLMPDDADKIKGGDHAMYTLRADRYHEENVQSCVKWIDQLSLLPSSQEKVEALSSLFGCLTEPERYIVLGTFA